MPELLTPPRETPSSTLDWTLSGRISDDGESRTIPVATLPFRIGRRAGLSLTLPRQTVSGQHAEIFDRDRKLYVHDLGSTNGTFVNGKRITGECQVFDNDLIQFADAPFRLKRHRADTPSRTRTKDSCDQALAIVQFDQLLGGKGLVPHFQPIIRLDTGRCLAFEALARSRLVGLENPAYMFAAAEQLRQTTELSRMLRRFAVQESAIFPELPHLFLNTHPSELDTPALLRSCEELRDMSPQQPITIEIHEAAITDVREMISLRHGLADLRMTLAFDDFGAGQARLAQLAEVRPHYLKFDRSMIRQLHLDASRRKLVGGFVQMIRELGILSLAEGIETEEERAACVGAGFELAQGYLHGRPLPASSYCKPATALSRLADLSTQETQA